MDAQLFLAHADDHRAVLDNGIPVDTALDAPASESLLPDAQRGANLLAPPDALPEQGWAIVAPKGPAGDHLLELIAPLRRLREEEQGREALVYRVEPGMDASAAANWIQRDYRDAVGRRESSRPRYLLLLGNPDVVSWDLQQMLGGEAFVGRLGFEADRDYEAYIDKVLQFAQSPEAPRANALFHSVLDGSRATLEGHKHLMQPLLEMARTAMKAGTFEAASIVDIPMATPSLSPDTITSTAAILRQSAETKAAMLFTMSHGAGIPKDGWKSIEQQRAQQGAMVLGGKGDLLTANDVAHARFLPGGVWFMFACYGAGTPTRSAYLPWLEKLRTLGMLGKVPGDVLAALPKEGESPFIAALPQSALANSNGPLGAIGHVDLAWSWSFLDYDISRTGLVPKTRAERFQGIVESIVQGHRFGVAHHSLAKFFRSVSTELTTSYEARAQKALGIPDFVDEPVHRMRRANLWMQRQDLRAYVLLGDPAARLPITKCPAGIMPIRKAAVATIETDDADERADAVLAVLRGTASVANTAQRHGVSKDEIERWVEVFVDAGRAALAKMP